MKKSIGDLSEEEYRAYPLESYSSLKSLLSSPEAFLRQQNNPFTGNAYTDLGTAVHNFLQGFEGDELIAQNHMGLWDSLKEYIQGQGSFLRLPSKQFEKAFIATYKKLQYKGKCDIYAPAGIIEIKTSGKGVDLKTFRKEAYSRDYDLQAAMYCHGLKTKAHGFIVVNTVEPYGINYYQSSALFLKSGYQKFDKVVAEHNKIMTGEEDPYV